MNKFYLLRVLIIILILTLLYLNNSSRIIKIFVPQNDEIYDSRSPIKAGN